MLDCLLFVVLFSSVGGLLVVAAAGTNILLDPKAWWRAMGTIALLGALIDALVRPLFWSDDCVWDYMQNYALYAGLSGLGTIILAAAARGLALFNLPAFSRVVFCLAIEFALRFGIGWVWVFLLFLYSPHCMK